MEREDLIEALATDLLERKALDVVLNNAVYEEFEIKPEEQEGEVATVEAQAVPGEMVEPTEDEPTPRNSRHSSELSNDR